jgi:hypothetical protein
MRCSDATKFSQPFSVVATLTSRKLHPSRPLALIEHHNRAKCSTVVAEFAPAQCCQELGVCALSRLGLTYHQSSGWFRAKGSALSDCGRLMARFIQCRLTRKPNILKPLAEHRCAKSL